jgi:hypothetical protein
MSLRPGWTKWRLLGQLELCSETLPPKANGEKEMKVRKAFVLKWTRKELLPAEPQKGQ